MRVWHRSICGSSRCSASQRRGRCTSAQRALGSSHQPSSRRAHSASSASAAAPDLSCSRLIGSGDTCAMPTRSAARRSPRARRRRRRRRRRDQRPFEMARAAAAHQASARPRSVYRPPGPTPFRQTGSRMGRIPPSARWPGRGLKRLCTTGYCAKAAARPPVDARAAVRMMGARVQARVRARVHSMMGAPGRAQPRSPRRSAISS
mmetsp:Transcript_762/g.2005  ORF Transcript_762/g.2005 Transcript_762/m.2005 type:complete len:205 (-) Transcript_762:353-967(-)